jgi:hypothetical protein
MTLPGNRNILEALDLSRKMVVLADKGESEAQDDSCAVLYGVIRDCAYTIKSRAEHERDQHRRNGHWQA